MRKIIVILVAILTQACANEKDNAFSQDLTLSDGTYLSSCFNGLKIGYTISGRKISNITRAFEGTDCTGQQYTEEKPGSEFKIVQQDKNEMLIELSSNSSDRYIYIVNYVSTVKTSYTAKTYDKASYEYSSKTNTIYVLTKE